MPCYDPPPPWENAQKKNAEQAVRLLCSHTKAALDAGQVPARELLMWFAEHREIDRQIASTAWYGKTDPAEAERAAQDVHRAKRLLNT